MPDRVIETAKASLVIGGAIVSLFLWGARLEFQVGQKASREEVVEMRNELKSIHREVQALRRMQCRETPSDSSCE